MGLRSAAGAQPKWLTLSYALAHHEGSLRASLRAVYGIDLREVLGTRTMRALDLADLVLWLPPGCAFWMDFGGPAALTLEARELRHIAYWLRVLDYRMRGSKGERPKPAEDPPYAHERRARQQAMQRKAERFLRRQRG